MDHGRKYYRQDIRNLPAYTIGIRTIPQECIVVTKRMDRGIMPTEIEL